MNLKKRFGARLRQLRKQARWTQEQLAEKLDTSPEVISRMEKGRSWVSAERLEKMAGILKCRPAELLNAKEDLKTPLVVRVDSDEEEIQRVVDYLREKPPSEIRRVRRALEILLDKP